MNNKINRATVKEQAKQLIKGNVITLFIISIIVSFLTSFSVSVNLPVSSIKEAINAIENGGSRVEQYNNDDFDFGYFDNYGEDDFFGNFGDDYNPIDQFGNSSSNNKGSSSLSGLGSILDSLSKTNATVFGSFFRLASFLLSPLTVTLTGFYLAYVRKSEHNDINLGFEIKHLFKVSFNQTYGKKLAVNLIKMVLTGLLSVLLIIPGIIFNYSSYFAFQIMCECPHLSPMDAIRLSKKMIKGNRGELFALDLSFIPWYFLVGVTVGIAGIYVLPYVRTTQALYYENFKIRALMEGRVAEDDFKSPEQRAGEYAQNQYQQSNQYQQAQSDYFYTPEQPQSNAYSGNYYTPSQPENNYSGTYTPPQPTPQDVYTPQPESDTYYGVNNNEE